METESITHHDYTNIYGNNDIDVIFRIFTVVEIICNENTMMMMTMIMMKTLIPKKIKTLMLLE